MLRNTFFPLMLASCGLWAQGSEPITASVDGHIFKPAHVPATDAHVASLRKPDGFTLVKFAEDLGNPRMMAVRDDGTVYVARPKQGDVLMLRDRDGDGRAEEQRSVMALKDAHGLAIRDGKLYVVAVYEVYEADLRDDGTLSEPRKIMEGLPDGGQHANRTLAFGPDGMLYVSAGSTCNACEETSEESATLLVADPNRNWERRVFAKGLRNTIGFDWHPSTGALYGLDHGIDWLGDDSQREELNRLEDGKHYGWPYVFEDGQRNPADEPPNGMTWEEFAATTEFPLLTYTAHSAPLDFVFYRGSQFPTEYRDAAFATLRGSWNRKEPSGYKVVRVTFDDEGNPQAFENFIGTFLTDDHQGHFGRLCGLVETPDGALLFSDDTGGVIYRVAYEAEVIGTN
ncbi:MAG: PQQ-dependent sugar dehydrogenase [Saprospiraceae bacterium]